MSIEQPPAHRAYAPEGAHSVKDNIKIVVISFALHFKTSEYLRNFNPTSPTMAF
jgi:hypothetical protein